MFSSYDKTETQISILLGVFLMRLSLIADLGNKHMGRRFGWIVVSPADEGSGTGGAPTGVSKQDPAVAISLEHLHGLCVRAIYARTVTRGWPMAR